MMNTGGQKTNPPRRSAAPTSQIMSDSLRDSLQEAMPEIRISEYFLKDHCSPDPVGTGNWPLARALLLTSQAENKKPGCPLREHPGLRRSRFFDLSLGVSTCDLWGCPRMLADFAPLAAKR